MNATEKHLVKAYKGSYYTITGCGGDLKDWREGYNRLIKEGVDPNFDIDKEDLFFFSGKDINNWLGLKGDNRYRDDLTFMTFSYETCSNSIVALAMFKLRMEDRWLDDIVDNNLRREGKTFDDLVF